MSREWLALYTAMLTKPKYRRLSPMGRGGLLHILVLAGFQSPEATWDPEELRESLALEGFPPGVYDELMGLGWLEHEGDGVAIHDWDQHQLAATLEVKRTWEADRKRRWRRSKKVVPSSAPPTPKEDMTPQPQHMSPGHVPDMSRTPELEEVVAVYEEVFGPVTPGKERYLQNILSRWPSTERVIAGLRSECGRGATRKDICGRLEEGLKAGDELQAAATLRVIEDHTEMAV